MKRSDKFLFGLLMLFGSIAVVVGMVGLNIAPILVGLGIIVSGMFYKRVVEGLKSLNTTLESLRSSALYFEERVEQTPKELS